MSFATKVVAGVLFFGVVCTARAVPITNGSFETGDLTGWQTAGDVSVQTAALGSAPPDGQYDALIATDTFAPFSGTREVSGAFFYSAGYPQYFGPPAANPPAMYPDNGAGDYSFAEQNVYLRAGETFSFNYNFVTQDSGLDYAFLFVQSLDQPNPYTYEFPGDPLFVDPLSGPNLYQFGYGLTPAICDLQGASLCTFGPSFSQMPFSPSSVQLCTPGSEECFPATNDETGWQRYTWVAPQDGNYAFSVGVQQQVDDLVPSALLVDNFQISAVPEPGMLGLFGGGLAGVLLAMRRRKMRQPSRLRPAAAPFSPLA